MSFPFPLRPDLLNFSPYVPGLSIEEIKERYQLHSVVKLASNENPLGTSPLVQEKVRHAADQIFRYIHQGAPRLVQAIAQFFHVAENTIVVGNGSDEVIDLLIRACPSPGKNTVLTCSPCFSLYTLQSRLCGVEVQQVPLLPDFSFDWDTLAQSITANTALIFLTSPDNPSGYCPPLSTLRNFAQSLPSHCLLVIDEAYMDFCEEPQNHSLLYECEKHPNVIFLRTFSKSFGLAGIRLGFGVMNSNLAKTLCAIRLPFSINILAEVAGIAALEDSTFRTATLKTVSHERKLLYTQLSAYGAIVYPGQGNFLMFQVPPGLNKNAHDIFLALLQRGVIIRPLASYGLPDHLRVSIGSSKENQKFLAAFKEVLNA